jgi:hypothetical protein
LLFLRNLNTWNIHTLQSFYGYFNFNNILYKGKIKIDSFFLEQNEDNFFGFFKKLKTGNLGNFIYFYLYCYTKKIFNYFENLEFIFIKNDFFFFNINKNFLIYLDKSFFSFLNIRMISKTFFVRGKLFFKFFLTNKKLHFFFNYFFSKNNFFFSTINFLFILKKYWNLNISYNNKLYLFKSFLLNLRHFGSNILLKEWLLKTTFFNFLNIKDNKNFFFFKNILLHKEKKINLI